MLEALKPFFKNCKQDVRLHKRLELFCGYLRDVISDQVDPTDQVIFRDFCNVSLSLVNFAKFDPSKLVKFELNNSMTFYSESVEYDSSLDTFSQRFQFKKNLEMNYSFVSLHLYTSMDKLAGKEHSNQSSSLTLPVRKF